MYIVHYLITLKFRSLLRPSSGYRHKNKVQQTTTLYNQSHIMF